MEGMQDEMGEGGQTASDVIQKFEEELEINDFPQPVRWKITSRVSFKFNFMLNTTLIFLTFYRKLWLRLANFPRQVSLFVARTVQPVRRLLKANANFTWPSKAQAKWPFLKPERKSFAFSRKKCFGWPARLATKYQERDAIKSKETFVSLPVAVIASLYPTHHFLIVETNRARVRSIGWKYMFYIIICNPISISIYS